MHKWRLLFGSFIRKFRAASGMLVASALAMIVGIVAGLYVVRILPYAEYGKVAYFITLHGLGLLLFGLALSTKAVTDVSVLDDENREQLGRIFYSLLVARFATFIPLLAIGFILSAYSSDILYLSAAASATLSLLQQFMGSVLQARRKVTTVALLLLLQPLLYLVGLVGGTVSSATDVFIVYAASWVITAVVTGLVSFATALIPWPKRDFLSLAYIKQSVNFVGQFSVAWAIESAYTSYAIVLFGSIAKFEEVAFLAVPLNISQLFTISLTPVLMTTYYPLLCNFRKRNPTQSIDLLKYYLKAVSIMALLQVLLFAAYPDLVIKLIYTSKYAPSVPVLVMISPFAFFLPISRLLMLTMAAYDMTLKSVYATATRLLLFIIFSALILTLKNDDPISWLALAYVLSALLGMGIEIWMLERRIGHVVPLTQTVGAACAITIITLSGKFLLPNIPHELLSYGYKSLLTTLIGGVLALVIFFRRDFVEKTR